MPVSVANYWVWRINFPMIDMPVKTDLQPLLSAAYCLCMHAVIRSTSGTSALHSRMASSEQSRCCSSVQA